MCTAIGTAVGSVLQDMQGFQLTLNFIVLPLFFLKRPVSGARPASGGWARGDRECGRLYSSDAR